MAKLIAYVLMPDHFYLISNPRDGRIREFVGELKSFSAKRIVEVTNQFQFPYDDEDGHHVWQEKLQGHALVERLDDLAKDQLHPRQPCESRIG